MNAEISVITVCFNSAKTIEQTIQSVLRQSIERLEYIIVDGGSTDGTLNIIDRYASSFKDDQLIVISEPDNGIYDAMNKGISRASGELIGIINSDDWYEDNALNEAWKMLRGNKAGAVIVYGGIYRYENEILEGAYYVRHEFLKKRTIMHPACFVTRKVYEDIGVFDLRYPYAADYDFLLRAFENNICFIGVNIIFANFRGGGASSSKKIEKDVIKIQYDHKLYSRIEYLSRMAIYSIKLGLFYIKMLIRKITGAGSDL